MSHLIRQFVCVFIYLSHSLFTHSRSKKNCLVFYIFLFLLHVQDSCIAILCSGSRVRGDLKYGNLMGLIICSLPSPNCFRVFVGLSNHSVLKWLLAITSTSLVELSLILCSCDLLFSILFFFGQTEKTYSFLTR